MSGTDWAEVVGTIGIFAFVITVVTVIIVQVATTIRARAALAREADTASSPSGRRVPGGTEQRLAELERQSAQTQARIAAIERILKDVE